MVRVVMRRSCGGAAWWTSGAAALALVLVLVWPPAVAYASGSKTFGYTGAEQDWTVPAGVTSVTVQAFGAAGGGGYGGGAGGQGGSVTATISVTPGETLAVFVGGKGADGDGVDISSGGFDGGADGASGGGGSGGGGGASDVRQGGNALSDRVVVAGGGGGGGSNAGNGVGGAGGGTTGATGGNGTYWNGIDTIFGGYGGGGGTQSAGGSGGADDNSFTGASSPGSSGSGGAGGGYGASDGAGGGGGGGYFGGGGGGPSNFVYDVQFHIGPGGGGGGGSSFAEPSALGVSHTQGGHSGNGQVVITYALPAPRSPAGFVPADGSPFAAGGGAASLAVGDLNGDGHPDLAFADWDSGQVTVLLGDGSGGFTAAPGSPYASGSSPNSIAIGDVNGDGHPDLAVANYGGGVTVLLGDGSGGFTAAPGSPFAAGSGLYAVAVGDLNGDGKPDIAVANSGSNDVTVLLGDGNGGFSAAAGSPFPVGTFPSSVAIGDLNGDGHPDLAVANYDDGDVTVLLGDGSGGFTAAAGSPFVAGSAPRAVAIGDLDGDGNPDIVVANSGSNDATVLLGDGSGGFTPAAGSPFAAGTGPYAVAVGDVNGDGHPDLAFANRGATYVTLLLGDGGGGFTAATGSPFAAGSGPNAVVIGDLDGDGHPDLAAANYGSSDATVLLQVGAPTAPTGVSATPGDGQATVSWSPPDRDGHSAITAYTVTAAPGGQFCGVGSAGRSCVVAGLVDGTAYTFTVTATNGAGTGPASAPTAAVVPQSPDAPTVTGFDPTSGGGRSTVTVTGTNFTGATVVKVNGANASFRVTSATTLTLTVPDGATSGPIAVTNPHGTGTSTSSFTVADPPAITDVSPGSGSVGTTVTITGTNLGSVVAVRIGDIITVPTSHDATHVVFTVPPGALTGPIEVLAASGTATSAAVFTVIG